MATLIENEIRADERRKVEIEFAEWLEENIYGYAIFTDEGRVELKEKIKELRKDEKKR